MIRLIFMTDDSNMIGCRNPEDMEKRVAQWPQGKDFQDELGRIFYGKHIASGDVTYPAFYANPIEGMNIHVLSLDKNFDLRGNPNAELVNDFKVLVDKFSNSDEVLLVTGGKTIWELFLPYADEIVVAYTDKVLVPGDILFDSWRDVPKTEIDRVPWEGGATITYKVKK